MTNSFYTDNNKLFYGSQLLGLKIVSPILLKKKSKQKLSKILVIISSQEKVIIRSILTQLKKNGLKKEQIITKNFHELL